MDLVLISGHSSGLGKELTQLYLDSDATVIGMARSALTPKHPRLYQFHFDLSKAEFWEQKLRTQVALLSWSRVILINNAGTIHPTAPFGGMEGDAISKAIALNVAAPLRLMNLIVDLFPHSPVRIANISSKAARKVYPSWGVYCSSKAAVDMASAVLASEMEAAGRDVRIITYSPGPIDTPMQAELRKKSVHEFPEVERFKDLHASGTLRSAKDAAMELKAILQREDLPYHFETKA